MPTKIELVKLSDNFRQLSDNFPTTKKEQKTNKILKIYIYTIEVVGTFLLVSTPVDSPPLLGVFRSDGFLFSLPPTIRQLKPTTFSDNLKSATALYRSVLSSYYFTRRAEHATRNFEYIATSGPNCGSA